ncbi:MAG: Ig-like domain-containing protein [Candidatus Nanoarchaeia archaeon]
MANKRLRIFFGAFALLVLSVLFVWAVHTTLPTNAYLLEDVSTLINITVNNTDVPITGNITTVNISLPSTFTYIAGTNGTTTTGYTFSNTSSILSWFNNTGLILNVTSGLFWFNASASTPGEYNITVFSYNVTGATQNNVSVTVNDTTVPEVVAANITLPSSGSNHSDTVTLNVSIFDNGGVQTVFFNITNSTGLQNATATASNPSGSSSWNATINTTGFPEGTYNITVFSNDSAGNSNNTALVSGVIFDNTAPTVSLSSSSSTKNSLTLTVTITDSSSGMASSCSSDRDSAGASISGTGLSQTLTESSLNCGTSYSYVVSCTDRAGNLGNSASTSFSTDSCSDGSSSSSGGGTSTSTWTNTFNPTDQQLSGSYTKTLGAKNRVRFKVGTESHHVGVKSLTETTATIEVASHPVETTLSVGEEVKVDVTHNGFYDVFVKLNSITNNQADVTIQTINEEIPEGEPSSAVTDTSGETRPAEEQPPEEAPEDGGGIPGWAWALIIIVVLVAIGWGAAVVKRRNQ